MNINNTIKIFNNYLNSAWKITFPLLKDRFYTSDEESINDWLQANWELLVERKILDANEYLEVYGDGADFYGSSSRITDIKALPTHRVVANSLNKTQLHDILNNETIEYDKVLVFDRFVGFENEFYTSTPNFDYALLNDENDGIERVVSLDDISYGIQKI